MKDGTHFLNLYILTIHGYFPSFVSDPPTILGIPQLDEIAGFEVVGLVRDDVGG